MPIKIVDGETPICSICEMNNAYFSIGLSGANMFMRADYPDINFEDIHLCTVCVCQVISEGLYNLTPAEGITVRRFAEVVDRLRERATRVREEITRRRQEQTEEIYRRLQRHEDTLRRLEKQTGIIFAGSIRLEERPVRRRRVRTEEGCTDEDDLEW